MTAPPTLQEMAEAIEAGRVALAEAQAREDELREPYQAAVAKRQALADELKSMRVGLAAAKRARMIERALEDAGIESEEPPIVLVASFGERAPLPYELVAIGPSGTGLYRFTPERSHRYQGKEHAVRGEAPPGVFRRSAMATAGLVPHEERGKGPFGAGSGSMKPKPPPEGGKWRWLKVREQEELPA